MWTKNIMHRITKITVCLVLLLVLQACQDRSMSDLKHFVATAHQDKKPEIEPLPEMQPYVGYQYSAGEDDDPFSFGNIVTSRDPVPGAGSEGPVTDRRKEPLEKYPLDALKFVGTMTQENVPWVIVKTPESTALRATVGNYMGQQDGKIKQIIPDEQKIVLAELVLDPKGQWVTRDVEITIDE